MLSVRIAAVLLAHTCAITLIAPHSASGTPVRERGTGLFEATAEKRSQAEKEQVALTAQQRAAAREAHEK